MKIRQALNKENALIQIKKIREIGTSVNIFSPVFPKAVHYLQNCHKF